MYRRLEKRLYDFSDVRMVLYMVSGLHVFLFHLSICLLQPMISDVVHLNDVNEMARREQSL